MNDKELITSLGGSTKVAELLGFDKSKGGVQRVQNWISRGIPPKVKLLRPDIFLRGLSIGKLLVALEETTTSIEAEANRRDSQRRTDERRTSDRRAD